MDDFMNTQSFFFEPERLIYQPRAMPWVKPLNGLTLFNCTPKIIPTGTIKSNYFN